jgi:hypothetical protein
VPEILDRLQRVTDTYLEDFNVHRAFVYLVAELFETTNEEQFVFTDGARDGGIDFFVQDVQSYSLYQCKCPAIETLEASHEVPKFARHDVQDIVGAATMLLNREGQYDVSPEVARLRTDFQRDLTTDPESTSCNAALAVLGDLTPAARDLFRADQERLRDQRVALRLVTWRDIYRALHELDTPADVDFSVDLQFDEQVLRQRDYCYLLAHASDFYQAWRNHEWNLFDWNVRLQLPRSRVNRRIVESLKTARGRKSFHHYNNGILITCRSYRVDEARKRVRLKGPQIVNGCQTVCAIRDAYNDLTPREQRDFDENVMVQVKVIKSTNPQFLGELVVTTNDQNPMSSRNLKSNASEQKDLQRAFRGVPESWFYERKDGELRSLLSASRRVRWFRKSDYAVPRTRSRFRKIDSKQLAKDWFSWIGYSDRVLRGGLDFFAEQDVYNRVFKSRPNSAFWEESANSAYFHPSTEHFEPGIPSIYQYLLATAAAAYVDARRVGWRTNRQEALARGLARGQLRGDVDTERVTSSAREVDEFLAQDQEYRLNIILNNSRDILVELFAMVLARRYGSLTGGQSRRLLQMPSIEAFCTSAFNTRAAPQERQDGTAVLGPVYAFLQYSVKQYYFENKAEIQAKPRLKAYFFDRKTVDRLRDEVLRVDEDIRDWDQPWKSPGMAFTESLPELA